MSESRLKLFENQCFIQPILVLANYPTLMYFCNLIFMNYDLALVVLETVMN